MARRKSTTRRLRDEMYSAAKEAQDERQFLTAGIMGSRQEVKETPFTKDLLNRHNLLTPPYDPDRMYTVCESSGILPQCVDAMIQNIDGFGYEFKYAGPSDKENDTEVTDEKDNLGFFFDRVNEKESFRTLRIALRRDIETTGNGYVEIIRFKGGTIGTMYHMDARLVRLQAKQDQAEQFTVRMWRNGKERPIPIMRRFRKYAMMMAPKATKKLKWFKEFGDPRRMCAISGMYESDLEKEDKEILEEASEVLHFKIGHGTYGVPRWSGQVLNALGMNSADYVNWDLFENQVVPPLVIMVSGGTLTTESIRDIKKILIQKRGVENFNKTLILESQSEGNVTDKSNVKIELKELSVARKEDAMFVQYTDKGEHRVRSSFRLPPLYAGRADTYSKSTADSSKMIAEEQVFVPERSTFDEIINLTVMPYITNKPNRYWLYSSKGPRLITGIEVIEGFKEFSRAGIITINEGIRIANRMLNMDITKYDQPWANYPIPIVIEMARMGVLKDIEEISDIASELGDYISDRRNPTPADGSTADDEVPEDEEMAKIYSQLIRMRTALRQISDKKKRRAEEADELTGYSFGEDDPKKIEHKEPEPEPKTEDVGYKTPEEVLSE
jgi:PBSX family phage portal protein